MKKALRVINIVVGMVLIIVLLGAGVYLRKLFEQDSSNTILLQADQNCDLGKQPCTARLGDKTITLTLAPPVRYLQKIDIEAVTTGFEAAAKDKMWLDFSMSGMQMGINRFALSQAQPNKPWRGMAILPVCVSGRRDWQVRLSLVTAKASYAALYQLTLEK